MSSDGNSLLVEAEKKLLSKGLFGFGGPKLDEAADLYGRAGVSFKLAKKWKQSGDAFMQKALTLDKMGERDDATSAYLEAAKSFKKESPREAVNALEIAVQLLSQKGRFSAAANNQKQIAEIYENDLADMEKAMSAYDQAGEWYSGEDSTAQANACMLKVAMFSATLEQYEKAVDLFERVANKSLDNNLTKWSVREYLFKAGICILCIGDTVRTKTTFDRYISMDNSFGDTREYKLLESLLTAVENEDVEEFQGHIAGFDRLSKLDEWKVSLLLRIKKKMDQDEVDFT
ncbi:hypothetical protein BASA50_005545 [Batrachochytrium salamandrivorans]|uniref:Alpha-soluble NSF attachment protein n=1 Tax=Batrachochytrium salamandrivorans TaxID=1357716 RepID=A0ABQ8FF72_9FUNG|nr:hypothetical protein BASA60_006962 [Batrachochytrium salamandrivorans]KAH6595818.1 hypothetical protein BASA50_005545 [Batrachochytrium salamandrivorans]KAJ1330757.1 hypothetical protein BSLG_009209 [Batrachochytrium salamandrivorans]